MQKALEIKSEFYRHYTDEYGLGLLSIGKLNDNGILWLSMFHAGLSLCNAYGASDSEKFLLAAEKIMPTDGETMRTPVDLRTDAHDNMAGLVNGFVLAGRKDKIAKICDHLDKTGGVSDHTNGSKWSLAQMRQGSEIAFYRICCDRIPFMLDMIWLCGGIVFNAAKGNVSSKNLGWLRCFAMKKAGYSFLPYPYLFALDAALIARDLILKIKNLEIVQTLKMYFEINHPIIKIMELAHGF